jgi:hypothetical protein
MCSLFTPIQANASSPLKSDGTPVRTIAIVGPDNPTENYLITVTSKNLLPNGPLEADSATDALTAAVRQQHLELGNFLADQLVAMLRQRGLKPVQIHLAQHASNRFADNYDDVPQNVDAILDVKFGGMYGDSWLNSTCGPIVTGRFQVIDRKTLDTILDGKFNFDRDSAGATAYDFSNCDAVLSDLNRAVVGLKTGATVAAQQIADSIK